MRFFAYVSINRHDIWPRECTARGLRDRTGGNPKLGLERPKFRPKRTSQFSPLTTRSWAAWVWMWKRFRQVMARPSLRQEMWSTCTTLVRCSPMATSSTLRVTVVNHSAQRLESAKWFAAGTRVCLSSRLVKRQIWSARLTMLMDLADSLQVRVQITDDQSYSTKLDACVWGRTACHQR